MSKEKGKHNQRTSIPIEKSEASHPQEEATGSKFGRRKIACNWSKYDELPPEETEQLVDQYDFGHLSKTYSSDNNYFQLSSEKDWNKQATIPNSSLFSLNLKNLSAGLACIPFYDRIDVDKTLLLDSCIANCDVEAKANLLKYKPELDNLRAKKNFVQNDLEKTNSHEESNVSSALNSSLHITSPEKSLQSVSTKTENTQDEDLEDWLDSVLDD